MNLFRILFWHTWLDLHGYQDSWKTSIGTSYSTLSQKTVIVCNIPKTVAKAWDHPCFTSQTLLPSPNNLSMLKQLYEKLAKSAKRKKKRKKKLVIQSVVSEWLLWVRWYAVWQSLSSECQFETCRCMQRPLVVSSPCENQGRHCSSCRACSFCQHCV